MLGEFIQVFGEYTCSQSWLFFRQNKKNIAILLSPIADTDTVECNGEKSHLTLLTFFS
jgi:hypothetical protein